MAEYYETQTISGYNSSPPPDDASTIPDNEVTWEKHVTKLSDPVKTLSEAINTQLISAFGKMFCNGVSTIATNTTVGIGDLGKFFSVSGAITLTMPAVATAGEGFVIAVRNSGGSNVTIAGDGAETVNGAASVVVGPNEGVIITTSGAIGWEAIIAGGSTAGLVPTADNFIVGNGTGWVTKTPSGSRASMGIGEPTNTFFLIGDGTTFVSTSPADTQTALGINPGTAAITGGTITGIDDLAVADGGTGASTPRAARENLGIYNGAVTNTGVDDGLPAGWTSSRSGSATNWTYTITHNLGHSNYTVVLDSVHGTNQSRDATLSSAAMLNNSFDVISDNPDSGDWLRFILIDNS